MEKGDGLGSPDTDSVFSQLQIKQISHRAEDQSFLPAWHPDPVLLLRQDHRQNTSKG